MTIGRRNRIERLEAAAQQWDGRPDPREVARLRALPPDELRRLYAEAFPPLGDVDDEADRLGELSNEDLVREYRRALRGDP